MVSVAAVDSSKNRASFSNFNEQVELTGPGVDVNFTSNRLPDEYRLKSFTNMVRLFPLHY